MRLAYVAGPYRAPTPRGILQNIRRAKGVAELLWAAGYGVICPHTNSGLMDDIAPDSTFLDAGLAMIDRLDTATDFVVLLDGWRDSVGSTREWECAWGRKVETWSWAYVRKGTGEIMRAQAAKGANVTMTEALHAVLGIAE